MKLISYIYHDILDRGAVSGFSGADADWYKLPAKCFEDQLDAILAACAYPAERLIDRRAVVPAASATVFTFDDGGASALHPTAELLERRGLRGRFFVVSSLIGTPGFVTASDCRDLVRRGHIVGSHSATHPTLFSKLAPERQLSEWCASRHALENHVGEEVRTASVPGGHYSPSVVHTAAAAGYRLLFTSEPTTRVNVGKGGLLVAGRYMLTRATRPSELAALARNDRTWRARRWLTWNARKAAKTSAGTLYQKVRLRLLSRRRL